MALIADAIPLGAHEADCTVADLVLEVLLRFDWLEGVLGSKQAEQDDAQAPDVRLEVVFLAEDNFGRHESCCATLFGRALIFLEFASQSEVANFDLGVVGPVSDEDVEELEVSVDQALAVHVAHTLCQLGEDVASTVF